MLTTHTDADGEWAPWVDPLLLDCLIENGLTGPAERSASAALALIDISGFTRLTEDLMRAGPVGAERVKEVLDATFGLLTGLASSFGGRVLKFPGDALLAVWPADAGDQSRRVRQACAYALHAIPRLTALRLPHAVNLTTRCAIVSGRVRVMFVGGAEEHWECLVDGEPLRDLAAALASARPGEVVVSGNARRDIGDVPGMQTVPLESGLHRLTPWTLPELDAALEAYREPSVDVRRPVPRHVRRSVPAAVLDHVEAGAPGWLAQFRHVTAVFVRLDAPADPSRAMDLVQRDVHRVQVEAARFGGAMNQAVVDDKGTVLVLAWGLSRHAHEDDATRAVLASMAIAGALSRRDHQVSIGVATGRVFTGARGGTERREYAMIGTSVNLAARLMQRAGSGILCDDATRAAARGRVVFERVAGSGMNGAPEPLPAYRPLRARVHAGSDADDLVGRTSELDTLLEAFRRLEAGEPAGTFVVEGEPGIGKSRLIASLVRRTQSSHVRSVIGRGDAVERSPHHAWRAPLERLLGLGGLPIDAQRSRIRALLEGESQQACVPLLNAVLGLQFEETDTTLRMTPQGRADETRELLLHLFSLAMRGTPTLLVLEDAHWFDSASWALADALSRRLGPVLCVVAIRPMLASDLSADALQFMSAPAIVRLPLDSLSAGEALGLAGQCLDADLLPPELGALVWEKAKGHPFYTEQLVLALRDAGLVHVERGDCELRGDAAAALSRSLPETVQGVVTSRIDRLTPGQQIALKVASVLGMDFGPHALHAVSPAATTLASLRADLDAMVRLGLLTRSDAGVAEAYSFKHAITLQVTYDLLPFAQRRELHAAVARQIEAEGSGTHALLAHHWMQANVPPKAFEHLMAAGEQSVRGDSNREAVQFFRQALAIDLSGADMPAAQAAFQRARCHRLLAEALWILGAFGEVPGELAASFRLLGGREQWVRSRGTLLATQLCVQGLHLAAGSALVGTSESRREQLLELSRAAGQLAMLRASPRDTVALLAASLLTLNLAERGGGTNVLALGLLGYTADAVGLRRLSDMYFDRARTRARAHQREESGGYELTLLFECMARFGGGEHARSVELMQEGLQLGRRIGDRRAIARTSDMLSSIHCFAFTASAAEILRHVTDAIDFIRDRPVADRIFFLETLRAIIAQLLRPEEAHSIFEPLEPMVEPSLQHCTDDAAALMRASDALFHTRQGRLDAALSAADAAFAWGGGSLRELPPTGWVFFEGPLEAYLAAAERAAHESPSTRKARVRVARRAVARLTRYATRCPIYGPRARHFEARLAMVDGRTDAARDAWERASADAVRLGLVFDEARAQLHLAGLARGEALRVEHLARARTLFEPVGSDYFMDLLEREEQRTGGRDAS